MLHKQKTWLLEMKKDKAFFKLLLTIAIPIVVQNLISSSLNMIDTVMIGTVGQNEIAAVGLANQLFMLIMLGLTGICAGSGMFISQYWGRKDLVNIKRMLGLALIAGIVYTLGITILIQIFPGEFIGFFNKEPQILELGVSYLKIVSLSYIFTAITFAYSYALRSIGETKVPMIVSGVAVLINIIGNTLFIFGIGSFPKMGVAGAALATLIARVIEAIVLVGIVYGKNTALKATVKQLIDIPKELVYKAITPILSIVGNELCWGLGTVIYTMAYGHIGSEAVASIQIVNTVTNFFLVVIFAMASASLTIVGNAIGGGEIEKAKLYAKRILVIAIGIGGIISFGVAVLSPMIVKIFNVTPQVAQTTINILLINAVILIPKIIAIMMIVGIFRGGGDAKYSLILEGGTMWGIGVPLSLIGVFILNLRLEYVVAMLVLEEITKAALCMRRFKTGKWIHDVIGKKDVNSH
ncbi:MAG: MATE family efflux transporter [Cellulosilyticaceae bacterium]